MIVHQNFKDMKQIKYHDRSKTTAGLLALFLGGLGVHKFYTGRAGMGFLYLVFCWSFIPAIIAIVEAIQFFNMPLVVFDEKYNNHP